MLAISENSPMLAHGVVAKVTVHLALTRSICLPQVARKAAAASVRGRCRAA